MRYRSAHNFRERRASAPRGLTLVELSVGLAITAIIGVAVCSFTFAAGTAWRGHEAGMTVEQLANLTSVRINSLVQTSGLFGAWSAGDLDDPDQTPRASVMIWTRDRNADGQIQTSEISLLEFDPSTGHLNCWAKPEPKIDETWTYAAFTAATAFDLMKTRSNRRALVSGVSGAAFSVSAGPGANGRPTLSYQFRSAVAGQVESFGGAAAIRAPAAVPQ